MKRALYFIPFVFVGLIIPFGYVEDLIGVNVLLALLPLLLVFLPKKISLPTLPFLLFPGIFLRAFTFAFLMKQIVINADAGQDVFTFGSFFIGGNFIIGGLVSVGIIFTLISEVLVCVRSADEEQFGWIAEAAKLIRIEVFYDLILLGIILVGGFVVFHFLQGLSINEAFQVFLLLSSGVGILFLSLTLLSAASASYVATSYRSTVLFFLILGTVSLWEVTRIPLFQREFAGYYFLLAFICLFSRFIYKKVRP